MLVTPAAHVQGLQHMFVWVWLHLGARCSTTVHAYVILLDSFACVKATCLDSVCHSVGICCLCQGVGFVHPDFTSGYLPLRGVTRELWPMPSDRPSPAWNSVNKNVKSLYFTLLSKSPLA